jgi:hypothetical protein
MAAKGARVHIYGDWDGSGVKRAQQDLGQFQRQAQGFSGAMTKSMLGVGAAFGGAFAIGALVGNAIDFLQDAAKAAIEDQKSVVALSKALDNLGLAHSQPAIEQFIGQLQMATGEADSNLRPAYQKLVTAVGDVSKAQDLLNLSMDISAATGKDLASVSQAMSRASLGQVSALTRLGIPLDQNIIKTKDFAAAQDVLTAKFGGQAAAAAETYAGKMARLNAAVDEAKETIGYALVEALDGAAEAFGGAGGFQGAILATGEYLADAVTGVGFLTGKLAELAATAAGAGDDPANLNPVRKAIDAAGPALLSFIGGPVTALTFGMATLGEEVGKAGDQMDALRDSASGGDVAMAKAESGLVNIGNAAAAAAVDYEALNDEIKAYLGTLSLSQAQDDFRKDMADLDETLKDNARTFLSNSDAAKENRDVIRGALGDVTRIVQQMVDDGQISADEFDLTFARMRKSVIDGFVKQGFTRKEVRAFLNAEGAWGPVIKDVGASVEGTAVATGKDIGKDIAYGLPLGFRLAQSKVNEGARRLVLEAESAARAAAISDSPSLLFAAVGEDLSLGVAKGITDKTPAVVKSAADLIAKVAGAAAASARESVDAGLGAVQSISDSILGTVLGGIRLSGQDAEGNALTPEQMVTALFGDIAAQRQAVSLLAASVGDTLPPELLQQFLAAGPEVAMGLAGLFARNPELASQLSLAYDELGIFTQEALGIPMGLAWGKVGEDSARELLLNARSALAARAEGFARWVSNNLAVTIPVNFDVRGANLPGRAAGGPVTGGAPYIVGERGPELFVPQASGSIVPNHRMGGGGGNSYSINVQAGVGDPRRIGQEIVGYIKRFEASNGDVFVAA